MPNRTLIIAPHPDDEILGCGGTLLRRKSEGVEICWLIVTDISEQYGWQLKDVQQRKDEIEKITKLVGFDVVHNLKLNPAQLDALPIGEVIQKISKVFRDFQPDEVFVPHYSDVHTDHRIVFDATIACTKWFRYPSVKRILSYETLSETEFGLRRENAFFPNVYVNIDEYLETKVQLMSIYESEVDDFPFPRSDQAVRAQAYLRGAAAGYNAAEAFQLLKERN